MNYWNLSNFLYYGFIREYYANCYAGYARYAVAAAFIIFLGV